MARKLERSFDWLVNFNDKPHVRQSWGMDAYSAKRLEIAFAERREQWKRDTARVLGNEAALNG